MIDLTIIRDKYASMTDEELLYLAREDRQGLTTEATDLLKQEFTRRCLDSSVFYPTEQQQDDDEEREPVEGFYNPSTGADDAILGRTYINMKNPATEQLADEEKKPVANLPESHLEKLIKDCDNAIAVNALICLAGIVITVITYISVADKGGTFYVAWGAIAFGGYRCIRAADTRDKLRQSLKNTQEQKPQPAGDDPQTAAH